MGLVLAGPGSHTLIDLSVQLSSGRCSCSHICDAHWVWTSEACYHREVKVLQGHLLLYGCCGQATFNGCRVLTSLGGWGCEGGGACLTTWMLGIETSQGAVYTAQVAVQLPSSMVSSVPGPGGLTGPGWPELEDRNASLDSHRPKGILSEWAWGSSLQEWGIQAHITADGGSSSWWRACEHFSSTFPLRLSSVWRLRLSLGGQWTAPVESWLCDIPTSSFL